MPPDSSHTRPTPWHHIRRSGCPKPPIPVAACPARADLFAEGDAQVGPGFRGTPPRCQQPLASCGIQGNTGPACSSARATWERPSQHCSPCPQTSHAWPASLRPSAAPVTGPGAAPSGAQRWSAAREQLRILMKPLWRGQAVPGGEGPLGNSKRSRLDCREECQPGAELWGGPGRGWGVPPATAPMGDSWGPTHGGPAVESSVHGWAPPGLVPRTHWTARTWELESSCLCLAQQAQWEPRTFFRSPQPAPAPRRGLGAARRGWMDQAGTSSLPPDPLSL